VESPDKAITSIILDDEIDLFCDEPLIVGEVMLIVLRRLISY
jgi:hypothetical protein